jgi:hypothetical protein
MIRARRAHCEGEGDPPVAAPADDPAPVGLPAEPPAGVLEEVGWFEVVGLDCVVDVVALGGAPDGGVAAVLLELEDVPVEAVPVKVVDDPSTGFAVVAAGPLGATPPTLITVEIPPVGFAWTVADTVVVDSVNVESALEVPDADAGPSATMGRRGWGGALATGGDIVGATPLESSIDTGAGSVARVALETIAAGRR